MQVLKLDELSVKNLEEINEAGMDYYIVAGSVTSNNRPGDIEGPFIIRGNGTVVPYKSEDQVYDLDNLIEGTEFPDESHYLDVSLTPQFNDSLLDNLTQLRTHAKLPPGYVSARGAHQLLCKIKLTYPTRFFRYTSASTDRQYTRGSGASPLGTIKKNTYLTSFNDHQFVNTGFGAVGRYALPLPIPASHLHDYTLPKGIELLVGTVAPQFGQAGGGVEAKTISDVMGVICNSYAAIDEY